MTEEKSELRKLSGVGKRTAQEWIQKGYATLDKIANASSQDLVRELRLNVAKAQKYIAEAQGILTEERIIIETAKNILEFQESIQQKISTGSKAVDDVLGGGIRTDSLTLFGGAYGTGKSQMCHQLAVNCILDLKRKAVYIETEPSTFHPRRMTEMAVFGRDASIDLESEVFGIRSKYVTTPDKLYKAYEKVENQLLEEGINIGLIVVDSFSAVFRRTFQGRGRLSERGEEQARHIGMLQKLSSKYNLAVVYTGQVYGIPDDMGSGVARRRMGISKQIYGGDYFLHSASYQASLDQVKGGTSTEDIWEIYVFDAPDLPRRTARFKLCKEGVRDVD